MLLKIFFGIVVVLVVIVVAGFTYLYNNGLSGKWSLCKSRE